eukprot:8319722-Alexandrium_andersonii.AAC.1
MHAGAAAGGAPGPCWRTLAKAPRTRPLAQGLRGLRLPLAWSEGWTCSPTLGRAEPEPMGLRALVLRAGH